VAKHRIFSRLDTAILPTDQVVVFAAEDDFIFGVLHSRFHEVWALTLGTRLETRPRYTPTTCFETFPLPFEGDTTEKDPLQIVARFRATHYHTEQSNLLREDPTPAPPAEGREAIAVAARELNELRESWLNPPEWTATRMLTFPGSLDGPWRRFVRDADRGIGVVHYPLTEPRDADCAAKLAKRTLTNLYNERPAWLANAHARLDAAVAAAYGWPADLSDDQILENLLSLNLARAAEEARGAKAKKPKTSREKLDDEML
jgi:hypothetical protein